MHNSVTKKRFRYKRATIKRQTLMLEQNQHYYSQSKKNKHLISELLTQVKAHEYCLKVHNVKKFKEMEAKIKDEKKKTEEEKEKERKLQYSTKVERAIEESNKFKEQLSRIESYEQEAMEKLNKTLVNEKTKIDSVRNKVGKLLLTEKVDSENMKKLTNEINSKVDLSETYKKCKKLSFDNFQSNYNITTNTNQNTTPHQGIFMISAESERNQNRGRANDSKNKENNNININNSYKRLGVQTPVDNRKNSKIKTTSPSQKTNNESSSNNNNDNPCNLKGDNTRKANAKGSISDVNSMLRNSNKKISFKDQIHLKRSINNNSSSNNNQAISQKQKLQLEKQKLDFMNPNNIYKKTKLLESLYSESQKVLEKKKKIEEAKKKKKSKSANKKRKSKSKGKNKISPKTNKNMEYDNHRASESARAQDNIRNEKNSIKTNTPSILNSPNKTPIYSHRMTVNDINTSYNRKLEEKVLNKNSLKQQSLKDNKMYDKQRTMENSKKYKIMTDNENKGVSASSNYKNPSVNSNFRNSSLPGYSKLSNINPSDSKKINNQDKINYSKKLTIISNSNEENSNIRNPKVNRSKTVVCSPEKFNPESIYSNNNNLNSQQNSINSSTRQNSVKKQSLGSSFNSKN